MCRAIIALAVKAPHGALAAYTASNTALRENSILVYETTHIHTRPTQKQFLVKNNTMNYCNNDVYYVYVTRFCKTDRIVTEYFEKYRF